MACKGGHAWADKCQNSLLSKTGVKKKEVILKVLQIQVNKDGCDKKNILK